MMWPCAAANPAIASRLQSMRPVGWVAELGSLGVIIRMSMLAKPERIVLPMIFFLLPFILFMPSFWFICESPASTHLIGPRIDETHHRADLGWLWGNIFFSFCIICFLSSAVMLMRRARHSRVARWGVALPAICCVVSFVLLYDNLFGPRP